MTARLTPGEAEVAADEVVAPPLEAGIAGPTAVTAATTAAGATFEAFATAVTKEEKSADAARAGAGEDPGDGLAPLPPPREASAAASCAGKENPPAELAALHAETERVTAVAPPPRRRRSNDSRRRRAPLPGEHEPPCVLTASLGANAAGGTAGSDDTADTIATLGRSTPR